MEHYKGNGIYDYLKNNHYTNFFWTSSDKWIVVYGNDKQEPKVVTIISEYTDESKDVDKKELNAIALVRSIIKNTDIHINFIRYHADEPLEGVQYWENGEEGIGAAKILPTISMDCLRNKFIQHGIIMNGNVTGKAVNDKTSSKYHEWQRENMGSDVTISDIDLIRFSNNKVAGIIELKRSVISLEKWEPYEVDFNNFILLSKLAIKAGIQFHIAYNYRSKNPIYDDISNIKLFRFDYRMEEYYKILGYETIEQFASEKSITLAREEI